MIASSSEEDRILRELHGEKRRRLPDDQRRREPAEGGVRTDGVVVCLAVLQQVLGVAHAREARLVQELVADAVA